MGFVKFRGLQQKVFTLVLFFILLLVAAYAAVTVWHQRHLTEVVQEASSQQQTAIAEVSENTMEYVLNVSMTQSTALQAYIADDLFGDVRSDVLTLQAFAAELFSHAELLAPQSVPLPSAENDGKAAVMLVHEEGADPAHSESLGLVGHMSEILLAMYGSSDKLASVFVGTSDGNMVLVNERSSAYIAEGGSPLPLEIRHRPWYAQAAAAGELIYTGVERDAYTDIPMIECAAPVYKDGELVAVVAADIFLDSIDEYVERSAANGGFLCVVNGDGRVLFSPMREGVFKVELTENAPDLRQSENAALARFVTRALCEATGLEQIDVEGKLYYMTGAPMDSVGWAVISGIEKQITDQPTADMLERYREINTEALGIYRQGAQRSMQTLLVLTFLIIALAIAGALHQAGHMVKPLKRMTARINTLRDGNTVFELEDAYRTGDEIEILAESFATLTQRTRDYITQITRITAEKERIGTELSLAARIQAGMLPDSFPAFPERREFDIYASMDPAKEVGGDFYDFFLIDEDHLGLVMADVSGKGVPAALFMMVSKILVRNDSMAGGSPAQVLEAVNNEICANNREEMFVTVWLGILNIKTGEIVAANAGHENPVLMPAGGQFELVDDAHGFVIGGLEGMEYHEYRLQLTPGSKLFLYTDGVPEATDAAQELFGTDRMLAALNSDTSAPPERVLHNVRQAVDAFVKDAEQFDDLTMLCLEYKGPDAGSDL